MTDAASPRRPVGTGNLYTRTNADGSETYHGRWWVDDPATGGRKQVRAVIGPKRRTGSKVGLKAPEAEKKLAAKMAERRLPVRDDGRTLEWAADEMFGALVGPEPQTIDTYRRDFDNHVRKVLGTKPLASIEREDVERLVAGMLTGYGRKPDGYSAKTIQNVTRTLSRIFNFAKSRRPRPWVDGNPVEGIELPKVDDDDGITYLDQPEIPLLLAAVDDESEFAALDRALYLTAAMTGLRQGELLALRWRDVGWKASKITVRKNRTRKHGDRSPKSKASRRDVPMPDTLGGELDRLFKASKFQADDARVFGNPASGDPISYTALDERLVAAVKASGVRPVTCHGLRHTFGTQCARAGVPMRTLQKWMGHARISTTERYAQFARDQQETAMVEAAFSALSQSLTHSEQN